jgi:hypothetical protein
MAKVQNITPDLDNGFNVVSLVFERDEFAWADGVIDDMVVGVRKGTVLDVAISNHWNDMAVGQEMPLAPLATLVFRQSHGNDAVLCEDTPEELGIARADVQMMAGPRAQPTRSHPFGMYLNA